MTVSSFFLCFVFVSIIQQWEKKGESRSDYEMINEHQIVLFFNLYLVVVNEKNGCQLTRKAVTLRTRYKQAEKNVI